MKAKDLGWVVLMGVVVGGSFWAASRRSTAAAPATPTDGPPLTVEPIEGSDLHRVILSARAAERLGIETALLGGEGAAEAETRLTGSMTRRGTRAVVPYSAVLYDAAGGTWIYTGPEPLVFVRERVDIELIDGNRVVLANGPPTGTTIVTVGGAELLAAELGH